MDREERLRRRKERRRAQESTDERDVKFETNVLSVAIYTQTPQFL